MVGFVLQSTSFASFGELKADHLHLSNDVHVHSDVAASHCHHHHYDDEDDCEPSSAPETDEYEGLAKVPNKPSPAHQHQHSDLAQTYLSSVLLNSSELVIVRENTAANIATILYTSPPTKRFSLIFRPPQA